MYLQAKRLEGEDWEDVVILSMTPQSTDADTEVLIIYRTCPGGLIMRDNDHTNFVITE